MPFFACFSLKSMQKKEKKKFKIRKNKNAARKGRKQFCKKKRGEKGKNEKIHTKKEV